MQYIIICSCLQINRRKLKPRACAVCRFFCCGQCCEHTGSALKIRLYRNPISGDKGQNKWNKSTRNCSRWRVMWINCPCFKEIQIDYWPFLSVDWFYGSEILALLTFYPFYCQLDCLQVCHRMSPQGLWILMMNISELNKIETRSVWPYLLKYGMIWNYISFPH